MGRDWSKQRKRDLARTARRTEAEILSDPPEVQRSKAELREEAAAAMAAYRGPIRRLPTMAALRCRTCGHRGTARVPVGARPAFRCSRCGSSLIAMRV